MGDFSTVVELYRITPERNFDGRSFSTTVDFSNQVKNIISDLILCSPKLGQFEDIQIDGDYIDFDEDDFDITQASGRIVTFTFIPARNAAERFYKEKSDFLGINKLKKGEVPDQFYIASIDFYSYDKERPVFIGQVDKICSIIKYLSEIAHYHDTRSESDNYRLVFVKNSDAKSTSIVLETIFTENMLGTGCNDNIIKSLVSDDTSTIPHYAEKIGTFRNTLVEFVDEHDYSFELLIKNWGEFLHLFENNLSTYMSGFSFHKARKEVATAEAEFAEKISKITSELTGKVLSIPISLLASISLFKLSSTSEMLIVILGVILTSLVVYLILFNQEKQFLRICHAKDIAFKPFMAEATKYPEDLKKDVDDAIEQLDLNQATCYKSIRFFMLLSWVPTSIAIAILLMKLLG